MITIMLVIQSQRQSLHENNQDQDCHIFHQINNMFVQNMVFALDYNILRIDSAHSGICNNNPKLFAFTK